MAHLIDIVNDGRFEDFRKEVETALLGALQFLGKDDVMVEVPWSAMNKWLRLTRKAEGKKVQR